MKEWLTCTVLLFDSSVCSHALRVSSVTNISTAFDSMSGTSELIIWPRGSSCHRGHVWNRGQDNIIYLHFFVHSHNLLDSCQREFGIFPMTLKAKQHDIESPMSHWCSGTPPLAHPRTENEDTSLTRPPFLLLELMHVL